MIATFPRCIARLIFCMKNEALRTLPDFLFRIDPIYFINFFAGSLNDPKVLYVGPVYYF